MGKRRTAIRFIDLFSGIGGMRLAAEAHGGVCVFSSEWDAFAAKTYAANFGHQPHGDINKVALADIPDHDLLLAGFPCQPFSSVGKRQGFDHPTQGTLFGRIVEILETHQPRGFVLENVVGLLSHDGGNTMEVILRELARVGYEVRTSVLNSADFGLPQQRRRVFLVGFKLNRDVARFSFPVGTKSHPGVGAILEENVSGYEISLHLQAKYIHKLADGRPRIVNRDSTEATTTLVASYHKIQRLTGTFVADGPTGLRLLSENECKRLQGFPDEFLFPVSRTQMYRQLGNSVSVPVVSEVVAAWKKSLVD